MRDEPPAEKNRLFILERESGEFVHQFRASSIRPPPTYTFAEDVYELLPPGDDDKELVYREVRALTRRGKLFVQIGMNVQHCSGETMHFMGLGIYGVWVRASDADEAAAKVAEKLQELIEPFER